MTGRLAPSNLPALVAAVGWCDKCLVGWWVLVVDDGVGDGCGGDDDDVAVVGCARLGRSSTQESGRGKVWTWLGQVYLRCFGVVGGT